MIWLKGIAPEQKWFAEIPHNHQQIQNIKARKRGSYAVIVFAFHVDCFVGGRRVYCSLYSVLFHNR